MPPTPDDPFADVFDEKTWTKERDKTGLKSGLTEKVSMGKEFAKFQKSKDPAAAHQLLKQLGVYKQVLKNKHHGEKYHNRLLHLLESQEEAVQAGIQIAEVEPMLLKGRQTINRIKDKAQQLLGDPKKPLQAPYRQMTQTIESQRRFQQRLEEVLQGVEQIEQNFQKGTTPEVAGQAVAQLANFQKDIEKIKADLEAEAALEWDDAEEHWGDVMAPHLTGLINAALSKHPELDLAVPPPNLFQGLLRPVKEAHARDFNPAVVKRLSGSGKPQDDLTSAWDEQAKRLIDQAIDTAVQGGQDTQWFKFVAESPKKEGKGKEVKMDPKQVPGRHTDDRKPYGTLLMKLAAAKNDCLAGARILKSRDIEAIFANQNTTQDLLFRLGGFLETNIAAIRNYLNGEPPNLDSARTTFENIQGRVNDVCQALPRNGDLVKKGMGDFILKSLDDEIKAKAVGG